MFLTFDLKSKTANDGIIISEKDQEAIPSPLHLLNLLMSIFILLSA